MNAEQNYRLLQDMDANRRFLLQAYRSNPALQALAEASPGLKRADWREGTALLDAESDRHNARGSHRPAGTDFSP